MILKKWDDLPEKLKNKQTKKYYDILKHKKPSLILKRLIDILMSIILLIILSPVFLILSILIKIDSKGPVFYKQERITTYGKTFKIFKFRTMVQNADKNEMLLTMDKDNRITKLGGKIRKYRLDELPQIINILIGDMSFVGTRPEVAKYVDMYTDEMKATLLMPSGVTSTASIQFKDESETISKYLQLEENVDNIYEKIILTQKMKYNLEYIENFSILEDFKICINTLLKVIK